MQEDQYLSIAGESRGLYKEKGSKFIAVAMPVDTLEEVKPILEQLRKKYHDARHHCYAYKIGKEGPLFRYNDDGEPSGTAGKPIFGQIESFGLTNILIVVIRYFGGVKLGTGGLIQAYRTAARDSLEQAGKVTRTLHQSLHFKFPYLAMNEVMKIIKEEELEIIKQEFTLEAIISLSIRKAKFQRVKKRFSNISGIEFRP